MAAETSVVVEITDTELETFWREIELAPAAGECAVTAFQSALAKPEE